MTDLSTAQGVLEHAVNRWCDLGADSEHSVVMGGFGDTTGLRVTIFRHGSTHHALTTLAQRVEGAQRLGFRVVEEHTDPLEGVWLFHTSMPAHGNRYVALVGPSTPTAPHSTTPRGITTTIEPSGPEAVYELEVEDLAAHTGSALRSTAFRRSFTSDHRAIEAAQRWIGEHAGNDGLHAAWLYRHVNDDEAIRIWTWIRPSTSTPIVLI